MFIIPRSSFIVSIWLWRKDSNLRMAALTVRGLTNLATPQKNGCGGETRTRTPSFTRRVLCYPIELRRNLVDWEGFKPSQEVCRTSMLSVTSPAHKHFRLPIFDCRLRFWGKNPSALKESNRQSAIANRKCFGGCGWSRTTNLALMRRLL